MILCVLLYYEDFGNKPCVLWDYTGRKQNILQSHLELIDVFIDAVDFADLNVKVM
jgi:hypothetical protein